MTAARALAAITVLIAAVSCLDAPSAPALEAQIRVVNGSNASVNILVDGETQLTGVLPSNVSSIFLVPGLHHVGIQAGSAPTVTMDLQATAQGVATAVLYTSSTGSVAAAALDTGSAVPAGKSKVRVSLLTKTFGDVDVWRTQPDFPTPTKIQTPFPYATTSPFVQSDSGAWEVFVTPVGSNTRLRTTGQFRITSGGRRTVVLLDSSGVPVFRILPE